MTDAAAPTEHEHPTAAAALVAALAEVGLITKGRTASIPGREGRAGYSYDYASLEDVVAILHPVLARHGLAALTPVHGEGNGLACTVTVLHTSGDRFDFPPLPFAAGRDAQATGSAITYHRRYALTSALGLAVGDDDDGAAATQRPAQAASRGRQAAPSASPAVAPRPTREAKVAAVAAEHGAEHAARVERLVDRVNSYPREANVAGEFFDAFGNPWALPPTDYDGAVAWLDTHDGEEPY